MNHAIKRILTVTVSLCLLFVTACSFTSCSRPPKLEDIYDRVVELVESSYDINTVFYGAGLPVYAEDSTYAEIAHLYYDTTGTKGYEVVSPYANFFSVDEIKAAAEKVYSAAYLEVLYASAFDGYAVENGAGSATFAYARYLEANDWIYRLQNDTVYLKDGMRVYDYSTMKIISPSDAEACYVQMDSWMPSSPDVISTDPIRLVLQDDGQWYLDSFTG